MGRMTTMINSMVRQIGKERSTPSVGGGATDNPTGVPEVWEIGINREPHWDPSHA